MFAVVCLYDERPADSILRPFLRCHSEVSAEYVFSVSILITYLLKIESWYFFPGIFIVHIAITETTNISHIMGSFELQHEKQNYSQSFISWTDGLIFGWNSRLSNFSNALFYKLLGFLFDEWLLSIYLKGWTSKQFSIKITQSKVLT